MSTCHFLLVYDLVGQRLVSQEEFGDVTAAVKAYAEAEQNHMLDNGVEIVLIGADSIETVRHTHGSYFDGKVTRSKYLAEIG